MKKSNTIQKIGLFSLIFGLFFISCSKSDDPIPNESDDAVEVFRIEDLNGLEKGQVNFDLENGEEVNESSSDWDIRLSGTTISFGNGASGQLVEGALKNYPVAPENGYKTSDIGGNGSYFTNTLYQEPEHAILMKPGVLLIVKTRNGKYVKLEMISYYKGNPDVTNPKFVDLSTRYDEWPKQHYTFNYVLQPDGTKEF